MNVVVSCIFILVFYVVMTMGFVSLMELRKILTLILIFIHNKKNLIGNCGWVIRYYYCILVAVTFLFVLFFESNTNRADLLPSYRATSNDDACSCRHIYMMHI